MIRTQSLSPFSQVESLESRALLSASVHSAGEVLHHGGTRVEVEVKHSNSPTAINSGKFRINDDKPGHDVNDDKGVDPAGHDANDDHGVDAVEVHQHRRGRGK
jgi:hypothetical protein